MITLGIDGGGTKTRCVAVNEEGEVLATTTVGSTNINAIEHGIVRERLAEAVVKVLSQANAEPADVVAVGLGMSGVGRPADVQLVRRWVAEILPQAYAYVDNDAVAALASGTGGDLYGVVIISGTGMIVLWHRCATGAGGGRAAGARFWVTRAVASASARRSCSRSRRRRMAADRQRR
jgi:N-acetylglucosamine kinase-like BadF-type ATPase